MSSYRVELTRSAEKEVAAVYRGIECLSDDPRPEGVKKLSAADRTYRIRIGAYRVVYEIEDDVLLVLVIRVGHRKDVYR